MESRDHAEVETVAELKENVKSAAQKIIKLNEQNSGLHRALKLAKEVIGFHWSGHCFLFILATTHELCSTFWNKKNKSKKFRIKLVQRIILTKPFNPYKRPSKNETKKWSE